MVRHLWVVEERKPGGQWGVDFFCGVSAFLDAETAEGKLREAQMQSPSCEYRLSRYEPSYDARAAREGD